MKVVFGHHGFTMQRVGGVSRYFSRLAEQLRRDGLCRPEILAPIYDNDYLTSCSSLVTGIRVPRIPLTSFARPSINDFLTWIRLHGSTDINVFHDTYYSSLAPPDIPRVVTVFDMIHEKFSGPEWGSDHTQDSKRRAVEQASHVICISESTRADLMERLNVPREKISVIHLAPTLALPTATTQLRIAPAAGKTLLYVGHRAGYKNFDRLLQAIGSSELLRTKASLLCFGGGPLSSTERLRIQQLGIHPQQVSQIAGDDDELAQAYLQANLLVYPSLYEGFGIPPLEAMALGCPVACSNVSSLPEVVGDAAQTFNPSDVREIRDAIERVLFDPDCSTELRTLGLRQAQKFSWTSCAAQTMEVYKHVREMASANRTR